MDKDIERFRRRAQEERDAASEAREAEKKLAHQNLADLYDRVAERLEQVVSRASMYQPRSRN
jgi:GTP1/Obg family GTP-binding protein